MRLGGLLVTPIGIDPVTFPFQSAPDLSTARRIAPVSAELRGGSVSTVKGIRLDFAGVWAKCGQARPFENAGTIDISALGTDEANKLRQHPSWFTVIRSRLRRRSITHAAHRMPKPTQWTFAVTDVRDDGNQLVPKALAVRTLTAWLTTGSHVCPTTGARRSVARRDMLGSCHQS